MRQMAPSVEWQSFRQPGTRRLGEDYLAIRPSRPNYTYQRPMTLPAHSIYLFPSEIADRQATAVALANVGHTYPADRFTTAHQIAARLDVSRNFRLDCTQRDSGSGISTPKPVSAILFRKKRL
jgi:hypothetical protein